MPNRVFRAASQPVPTFTEAEGSLPYSEVRDTGLFPEPD
jgi:hypothetical protein